MRSKTFTSFHREFILETVYQILSELPTFFRRYYKKTFGSLFSGHTVVSNNVFVDVLSRRCSVLLIMMQSGQAGQVGFDLENIHVVW